MAQADAGYDQSYGLDGNNFQDVGYKLSSQYAQTPGFFDAYHKAADYQSSLGSGDRSGLATRLNAVGDQFKTLFQNNVGRAPTDAEMGKFFSEQAGQLINSSNNGTGRTEADPQGVRNGIAQYIGDTFQQEAQKTSEQKLSDLSTQAGTLSDQYLAMGQKSLSSLADNLKTYQTSLFDKLRPQLNLAAQAGGYQDSGGQTLQEKGALTDLGNQATATLLPYQQNIQTNADAIRYGGASAPYSLASSFAANQPAVLSGFGAGGLNFNDTTAQNTYDYQHQLQLMNYNRLMNEQYQENTRPSFGYTLGNSFATNFGGDLANIGSGGIQGGAGNLGGGVGKGAMGAPLMGG